MNSKLLVFTCYCSFVFLIGFVSTATGNGRKSASEATAFAQANPGSGPYGNSYASGKALSNGGISSANANAFSNGNGASALANAVSGQSGYGQIYPQVSYPSNYLGFGRSLIPDSSNYGGNYITSMTNNQGSSQLHDFTDSSQGMYGTPNSYGIYNSKSTDMSAINNYKKTSYFSSKPSIYSQLPTIPSIPYGYEVGQTLGLPSGYGFGNPSIWNSDDNGYMGSHYGVSNAEATANSYNHNSGYGILPSINQGYIGRPYSYNNYGSSDAQASANAYNHNGYGASNAQASAHANGYNGQASAVASANALLARRAFANAVANSNSGLGYGSANAVASAQNQGYYGNPLNHYNNGFNTMGMGLPYPYIPYRNGMSNAHASAESNGYNGQATAEAIAMARRSNLLPSEALAELARRFYAENSSEKSNTYAQSYDKTHSILYNNPLRVPYVNGFNSYPTIGDAQFLIHPQNMGMLPNNDIRAIYNQILGQGLA